MKVVVRIRPMSTLEKQRKDQNIVEAPDERHCKLVYRATQKLFRYNATLDEGCLQDNVFDLCGVRSLIDSALDGFSATVFAYGQTGSGKTYSMAGIESKLGQEGWVPDSNDGIIPRSIRYMWE